jgi:hypothetical protein
VPEPPGRRCQTTDYQRARKTTYHNHASRYRRWKRRRVGCAWSVEQSASAKIRLAKALIVISELAIRFLLRVDRAFVGSDFGREARVPPLEIETPGRTESARRKGASSLRKQNSERDTSMPNPTRLSIDLGSIEVTNNLRLEISEGYLRLHARTTRCVAIPPRQPEFSRTLALRAYSSPLTEYLSRLPCPGNCPSLHPLFVTFAGGRGWLLFETRSLGEPALSLFAHPAAYAGWNV